MPRQTPPDRLERLVDCATDVFIERGYRNAQMADVAAALGVAKGTLYLYVESKEALFDCVVRSLGGTGDLDPEPTFPIRTPAPGTTLAYVRERLVARQTLPALVAALARTRVRDARAELAEIVGQLYDTLAENRRAIKLVDRSARDYPELAELWFQGAREGLMAGFGTYLAARERRRLVRPLPDRAIATRLVIETTAFWAVHRHWDAHPQTVDEGVARATVTEFIVRAFVRNTPKEP